MVCGAGFLVGAKSIRDPVRFSHPVLPTGSPEDLECDDLAVEHGT